MYSLEEKEAILMKIKSREDISEDMKTIGISDETIIRWKKELWLRKHIRQLIAEEKLEEAKQETEKITDEVSEPIKISILTRIARMQQDIDSERRLLDRRLEIEPNNIITLRDRFRVAKIDNDVRLQKKLLDKLLELDPKNVVTIRFRLEIARNEKDIRLQRKLYFMLEEKERKEVAKQLGLEDVVLQNEQQSKKGIIPIEKLREMIYGSEDLMQCAEQIKETLDGHKELDRELILAELFMRSGLQLRAEKSLKSYRKKLEENPEQQMELRIVKKALELVRNTKARKNEWDEFWKKLTIGQNIFIKKELDER